jgi:hypothetical protein
MREKLKIIPLTKNSSFLFSSALTAKFGSGAALVASDASYGNITTKGSGSKFQVHNNRRTVIYHIQENNLNKKKTKFVNLFSLQQYKC